MFTLRVEQMVDGIEAQPPMHFGSFGSKAFGDDLKDDVEDAARAMSLNIQCEVIPLQEVTDPEEIIRLVVERSELASA